MRAYVKEPKLDEKTRELLRLWGPREVPTAQVTGGEITPGTYRALPTLGWIERRSPFVVLGVQLIILHNQEEKSRAAVTLGLPITKRSELLVNAFLRRLNWDGRVWPHDDDQGWPVGTSDEEQLRQLLKKARIIGATLCFPADPVRGATILTIPILKRSSPFNWAPFEELDLDSETTPAVAHLDRFRQLCKDPTPFLPLN